jgi:hypothetical protein
MKINSLDKLTGSALRSLSPVTIYDCDMDCGIVTAATNKVC